MRHSEMQQSRFHLFIKVCRTVFSIGTCNYLKWAELSSTFYNSNKWKMTLKYFFKGVVLPVSRSYSYFYSERKPTLYLHG